MKKRTLYVIAALAATGILAALLIYIFVYNKPHPDYLDMKPDFELSANELFEAFRNSENSEQYLGAFIMITDSPDFIESVDSLTVAVYAIEEGMFGDEGIRCTLHPELSGEEAATGISAVKGYCTGYNDTDVILEKCSFINNQ
jgi:hypothetical protein